MLKCGTVMTSLVALTTLSFAGTWLRVESILALSTFLWTFTVCSGILIFVWLVLNIFMKDQKMFPGVCSGRSGFIC